MINSNLQVNGNNPFEIFNYLEKGGVRIIRDNYGNPWFCLNDICLILEIKEPHRVAARVPDPYRTYMTVGVQTGVKSDGTPAIQNVNMNFVNEFGLYYAIGNSKKPEAERFKKWLYTEVIPSIRQKGYYINTYNPQLGYTNLVTAAVKEIGNAMEILETRINENTNGISGLNTRVDSMNDRVVYLEEFNNQGYYTVEQFLSHYGFDVNLVDTNKMHKMLSETCRQRNRALAKVYTGRLAGEWMYPYEILVHVSAAMGLGSN